MPLIETESVSTQFFDDCKHAVTSEDVAMCRWGNNFRIHSEDTDVTNADIVTFWIDDLDCGNNFKAANIAVDVESSIRTIKNINNVMYNHVNGEEKPLIHWQSCTRKQSTRLSLRTNRICRGVHVYL